MKRHLVWNCCSLVARFASRKGSSSVLFLIIFPSHCLQLWILKNCAQVDASQPPVPNIDCASAAWYLIPAVLAISKLNLERRSVYRAGFNELCIRHFSHLTASWSLRTVGYVICVRFGAVVQPVLLSSTLCDGFNPLSLSLSVSDQYSIWSLGSFTLFL